MTFLLGKDKLVETKKDRGMLVLLCLVPSFLYVGLVVVFFLTSSRSLMHIYPILLSIISTIYASYLLFYFTVFVRRYTKMTNLCKEAMEKRQYEEEMVVYSIDYKSITVRGVVFNTVTFFHLDDDKKSIIYIFW